MSSEPDDPENEPPTALRSRPGAAATIPHRAGRLEPGHLLNHIYEVRRLIGRGGMGEVYEGVNVTSDERVAIKVILPALAADPNIQALFRNEAARLRSLTHPAVVPYRVMAREPELGILYLVTEFVDGSPLCDLLGSLRPEPHELGRFIKRMANGLAAAHELGAVHRDMAPDNVLLPGGQLAQAKIIDFGIGKDLDAGKATLIGDRFAGKLGYVAPEQFGDFNRKVGPWTDVYSLGLVVTALASGRNPDMGGTLVEAIDRRRAGVDLSAVPAELRPVVAGMVEPDPARRFRSMGEVLAALERAMGPQPTIVPDFRARSARRRLILAGGAAGVAGLIALAGAGVFAAVARRPPPAPAPAAPVVDQALVAVQRAVDAALPQIDCSWIDAAAVTRQGGGFAVSLSGVAGYPTAAQAAVSGAVKSAGGELRDIDQRQVAPIGTAVCRPLNAMRSFRASPSAAGPRLSGAQREYEIADQADAPTPEARAVIHLSSNEPGRQLALFGLDSRGAITRIADSREALDALAAQGSPLVARRAGDAYTLTVRARGAEGWTGALLLTGKGPIDNALLTLPPAARPADWEQQVQAASLKGGWRSEMVWYRVVDDQPNAPSARPRRAVRPSPAAPAPGVRRTDPELQGLF